MDCLRWTGVSTLAMSFPFEEAEIDACRMFRWDAEMRSVPKLPSSDEVLRFLHPRLDPLLGFEEDGFTTGKFMVVETEALLFTGDFVDGVGDALVFPFFAVGGDDGVELDPLA